MSAPSKNGGYIAMFLIAIVAIIALVFVTQRGNDSSIAGAMDELGDGIENAAEELDPNRTTGEKVGDAVEDFGDSIQDAARK